MTIQSLFALRRLQPLLSQVALVGGIAVALPALVGACASDDGALSKTKANTDDVALPGVEVEWTIFRAGGQPSEAELKALAKAGTEVILDLRGPDENRGYGEAAAVEGLGMTYVSLPVTSPADLNANFVAMVFKAVNDKQTYLHCGSGQRAGAALAVLIAADKVDPKFALSEGRKVGLGPWEAEVTKMIEALPQFDKETGAPITPAAESEDAAPSESSPPTGGPE